MPTSARSRPTGPPSASRASASSAPSGTPSSASLQQGQRRGRQDPHRPVPLPPLRPRPDVGSRPRQGPRRPAARVHMDRRVDRVEHDGTHITRLRRPRRLRPRNPLRRPQLSLHACPSATSIRGHVPRRSARPSQARRPQPPLPRLPHRRPDRRQTRDSSPTPGSTSTTPASASGRVQNFQNWSPRPRPRPSQDQPRPRILLLRGRRPLDHARRRPDRPRHARRSTAIGLVGAQQGRRRLRRPHAQGLSRL